MADAWEMLIAGSSISSGDAWGHLYNLDVVTVIIENVSGTVISDSSLKGIITEDNLVGIIND